MENLDKTTARFDRSVARCSHPRLPLRYVSVVALRAPCAQVARYVFSRFTMAQESAKYLSKQMSNSGGCNAIA